jgi:hypothetical protein
MFPVLTARAHAATRRFALYSGPVAVLFLVAVLFGIRGDPGISNIITGNHGVSRSAPEFKARLVAGYGRLPLSFEANRGQVDAPVKFLARGRGYGLFLTSNEAVLEAQDSEAGIQDSGSVLSHHKLNRSN